MKKYGTLNKIEMMALTTITIRAVFLLQNLGFVIEVGFFKKITLSEKVKQKKKYERNILIHDLRITYSYRDNSTNADATNYTANW